VRAIEGILGSTNSFWQRAVNRWRGMSAEQRERIEAGFLRHLRACRSIGIEPEPGWVAEAIDEEWLDQRPNNEYRIKNGESVLQRI